MATARCYTKSGSVEKYESNLWSRPISGNWSSLGVLGGVLGTITTPDSNGNYTVTPANYFEDSNTPTQFYCYTMYGGVRKTFYFKESPIESIKEIYLQSGIGAREGSLLLIYLAFGNNEYLGNDKLIVNVQITSDGKPIGIRDFDDVTFTIAKNSTPSLYKKIFSLNPKYKNLQAKTISCYPMGGRNYRVTIRN